jgi:hypothetical protein
MTFIPLQPLSKISSLTHYAIAASHLEGAGETFDSAPLTLPAFQEVGLANVSTYFLDVSFHRMAKPSSVGSCAEW